MTSPSTSSDASSGAFTNPFVTRPTAIAASTVQLINISSHVPAVLDFVESNYAAWSTFFDNTLRKFGIVDHVDGSVDAQTRIFDGEWSQIDYCVVSWLYATVSKEIRDMVMQPRHTVLTLWTAIRNLFLDNAMHRAVYALQEFHNLYQGDMSINEYCGCLKKLSDTLRDVGYPVEENALVINTLKGLNNDFKHAIGSLTSQCGPPSFLYVRSFLMQEELRMAHTNKMEAAQVLLAVGTSSSSSSSRAGASSTSTTSTSSPSKTDNKKNKKRKQGDGKRSGGASTSTSSRPTQAPAWGSAYNPWTGVVQAWSMPRWRNPLLPVFSARPRNQLLSRRSRPVRRPTALRLASTPPSSTRHRLQRTPGPSGSSIQGPRRT
ncbi:hypothetical protein ACP70R_026755 [Stipagrostis hirtigluma subsp. patula]